MLTTIPDYSPYTLRNHLHSKSMNYKNISSVLVFSIAMVGCSKDNNNISNPSIAIKGTISNNSSKSAGISSANTASLANATKVLVFNSSGGYNLFNIENNSFTAKATQGTASALAFLDASNSYIGCLHAGGLNVLPLVSLADGSNSVIDLSNLTLDGTSVIPANDPIGSVIDLNQDEIDRFRQLGSFFGSLSKNIDADNDGTPDLLHNKALYVSTIFDIYCGKWGLNDVPPQLIDTSRLFTNYTLRISGGKAIIPSDPVITLTGPEGSPYADVLQSYYTTGPDCFISFFRRETPAPPGYPYGSAFMPFADGSYSLTLDNKTYTINYSNVNVKYFFILAIPTVHTNDNNEITSITIEYQDINGEPLTPENFVYQTMVQLNDIHYNQISQIGVMWESPEAKSNNELYTFRPNKAIQVSELNNINVCYMDMVGNAYNIGFNK